MIGSEARDFYTVTGRRGPVVATAVHDGHRVRPEVAPWLRIDDATRLREEDPFTARWTVVGDLRVVARYSRFEVDLNRSPELAIYRRPAEAWGLDVWKPGTPEPIHSRSMARYHVFYADLARTLRQLVAEFGRVIVLDLHSYNHRRAGPRAIEDAAANPDVNLGTGSLDRARWQALVDRFLADLRGATVDGRRLDVRENVRFRGGYLSQWVHTHFPHEVCALAIEVKKFFMDEWTGTPRPRLVADIRHALAGTIPGLRLALAGR